MNSIFLYSSLKFLIDSDSNMSDFTYVENVAHANICAEQVLSLNAAFVAGKVYF
jgi:plant 3beta-hydroxysteroid-4alpha-carboxylate 3-dehydrogenase